MLPFESSALCYDLLYQDKPYAKEAAWVHSLLKASDKSNPSLLSLGCGTCKFEIEFARLGWHVLGIDRSEQMLKRAAQNISSFGHFGPGSIETAQMDISELTLTRSFDAAQILFHIVNYLENEQQLEALFKKVHSHLHRGSKFVFDSWYGPGIRHDPPAIRIRRAEDQEVKVTRLCEPSHYPGKHFVDVRYTFFIEDRQSHAIYEAKELHRMRYLEQHKTEDLLKACGFKVLQFLDYVKHEPANDRSWNVLWVCEAG